MPQEFTTIKQLFDNLVSQITVYELQEAKEIVFWLIEHELNLKKIDVITDKPLANVKETNWQTIITRLNNHEPIQYILGETYFYGRRFFVDNSVLIPRSETEELIQIVLNTNKAKEQNLKILDIGTGSGCIAITLAKEIKNANVLGYDISEKALETASRNAVLNQANVVFDKVDILNHVSTQAMNQTFDIIVSNPPYVTKQEANEMRANVLEFEPHLALFVEDQQPLIFYEAIAQFASHALNENGLVVVEINESLGEETAAVLSKLDFSEVEIIKDIHQKNRFVKATFSKKIKKD